MTTLSKVSIVVGGYVAATRLRLRDKEHQNQV
jgi:hypothetical protein